MQCVMDEKILVGQIYIMNIFKEILSKKQISFCTRVNQRHTTVRAHLNPTQLIKHLKKSQTIKKGAHKAFYSSLFPIQCLSIKDGTIQQSRKFNALNVPCVFLGMIGEMLRFQLTVPSFCIAFCCFILIMSASLKTTTQ